MHERKSKDARTNMGKGENGKEKKNICKKKVNE